MTLSLSDSAHNSLIELLPWYVNGTLLDEEHRAIEDHIEGCRECRDSVEALSRISHAIRNDSPAPLVPPLRTDALLDALDAPKNDSILGSSWIPYAAAASIMILVATAWVNLWRPSATAEPPTIFETATNPGAGDTISYVVEVMFESGTSFENRDASLAAIGAIGDATRVANATYRITLTPVPASLSEMEQRIVSIEALPGITSARVVAVQLPVE
jgi:hypothetical protein